MSKFYAIVMTGNTISYLLKAKHNVVVFVDTAEHKVPYSVRVWWEESLVNLVNYL